MKNLSVIFKILGSVLIVFGILWTYILGIAISSSSHNISMSERDSAILNGKLALLLGPILIICTWLPWTKWFIKK